MTKTLGYGRKKRKRSYAFVCALCSVLWVLSISSCTKQDKMYKESRVLMDTYCTITVVSPEKEKAADAIEAGFAEIKKLETLLNYFADDSEISAINRAAGKNPVRVSRETLEIMKKTMDISKMTGGAFDPTIAPVISIWQFSKKTADLPVPPEGAVQAALKLVDYKKIKIDSSTSGIFLEEKDMELDLGGIAKGYAADKAVDAIRGRGIKSALVAVAGDIRGFGLNTSGQGWRVGIQNPRPESDSERPWEDIFASLELKDRAISTSGDYQRFFIRDGKRYHHILDTETGFPAESDLISVSVIAYEGYISDSIATAVFIFGSQNGLQFLESRGLDGVLVDVNRNVFLTKNLKGKIKILNEAYQLAD